MPVPVEGRASVNAQRLLEPLQMCRKRFGPDEKLSTLPRVEFGGMLPTVCGFPYECARIAWLQWENAYVSPSKSFRMIYYVVNWNKNPPVAFAFSEDSRYVVSRFAVSISGTSLPSNGIFFPQFCLFSSPTFCGPPILHFGLCLLGFTKKTDFSEDKTQFTKIRYALPRSTLFSQESSLSTLLLTLFSLCSPRRANMLCTAEACATTKIPRGSNAFL